MALDKDLSANGTVVFDDGETLNTVEDGKYFLGKMMMKDNILMMEVEHDGYQEVSFLVLDKVIILGLRSGVETVVVNGLPHSDWSLDSNGGLIITSLGLQPNDSFEIIIS